MTSRPLLIFDFDWVIVDGISEYWWSARKACLKLLSLESDNALLPEEVPQPFRELRPWVHKGWEMVLLTAELIRPKSSLHQLGAQGFSKNYLLNCKEALAAWHWEPNELQNALEDVRRKAISTDRNNWLQKHKPYPGVTKRLISLQNEGYDFAILTTKSSSFTADLLNYLQEKRL